MAYLGLYFHDCLECVLALVPGAVEILGWLSTFKGAFGEVVEVVAAREISKSDGHWIYIIWP